MDQKNTSTQIPKKQRANGLANCQEDMADASANILSHLVPAQSTNNYRTDDSISQIVLKGNTITQKDIEAGIRTQEQLCTTHIGKCLTKGQVVTPTQLVEVIKHQPRFNLKLGDMLILERIIRPGDLKAALVKQKLNKEKALGEILVSMGAVDQEAIRHVLVKKLGIPFVNITNYIIDPNAVMLVPIGFVNKHTIMPLLHKEKMLVIAMENPMNWEALNELRFLTNLNVVPVMASKENILHAIKKFYSSEEGTLHIEDLASELIVLKHAEDIPDEPLAESDNLVVRLVNKVIVDAYVQGVSDIHIETYSGKQNTKIRFRTDGTLSKYFEFPPTYRNALISRIKIMAKLDISEKRKPQDGKIEFKLRGEEKIELRVATIPTANGLEDIVMRVLAAAKPIPFEKIGLATTSLERIKQLATRPYGLFLICGPTGSGKTTTLHSILELINTPGSKIWTAEDPIEITQEGLRQVQVNSRIGWTFAAAMRSFLRADPDVIMVGEMRDIETAKIAIDASLTGHMVFSTLHTNSAPESMVRLLDLGMDPFNFSDALIGILAQRLAKRYCGHCQESHIASVDDIKQLAREYCQNTPLDPDHVYQQWRGIYANENGEFSLSSANGCIECGGTGYKGRIGLFEFLEANAPIKKLIQKQAPVDELQYTAINHGMRTLKQDGILKILQGHTDIVQIRAVCN